jgi:hypothetical protein
MHFGCARIAEADLHTRSDKRPQQTFRAMFVPLRPQTIPESIAVRRTCVSDEGAQSSNGVEPARSHSDGIASDQLFIHTMRSRMRREKRV